MSRQLPTDAAGTNNCRSHRLLLFLYIKTSIASNE